MAKIRTYDWYQDGFVFECSTEGCGNNLQVGIERLAENPVFECYQCGGQTKIENVARLVLAWTEARKTMQALHELIDQRREPTWAVVMGAKIFRSWQGD